jgi:hypothetical protein
MEGIGAAGGDAKSAAARRGDEPGVATHTGGTKPAATRAGATTCTGGDGLAVTGVGPVTTEVGAAVTEMGMGRATTCQRMTWIRRQPEQGWVETAVGEPARGR